MDQDKIKVWTEEALDLINSGIFRISDEGPLHAPVSRFTIRRNEDLTLILETEAPIAAKSKARGRPSGAIWIGTEEVKLAAADGVDATLAGVESLRINRSYDKNGMGTLEEASSVHRLRVNMGKTAHAAYTIEWLRNFRCYPFAWPDSITTVVETTVRRIIANDEDGITVHDSNSREGFSRSAARLVIDGQVLYVLGLDRNPSDRSAGPGCILYRGTPDELTRRKVRVALSFALGVYLVELGCTTYTHDWQIVSAHACNGYNLGGMAFKLGARPPAPLSTAPFQFDIQRAPLNRMVSALVSVYENFDLGNLSWAYWHACAATVHTAPGQFGAAIEGLTSAYLRQHPTIARNILEGEEWRGLQERFIQVLAASGLSASKKEGLKKNFGRVNQVPQQDVLKAILNEIGIELGSEEAAAWPRRNKSAHGAPIPEGQEVSAIRDMILLKNLFHRMLLRMANAADRYIDYASLETPHRRLDTPAD